MKNVYDNYIVPCLAFNDEKTANIEKIVNFNFGGDDLVIAATHSVFNVSIESDSSYQRIEFLGDAQMDSLVVLSQYLIETFIDEGRLSHTCAAIVCYHYLARRTVRRFDNYNICKYITIQSCKARSEFLQYINSLDATIDGVEFCMWLLIIIKKTKILSESITY